MCIHIHNTHTSFFPLKNRNLTVIYFGISHFCLSLWNKLNHPLFPESKAKILFIMLSDAMLCEKIGEKI